MAARPVADVLELESETFVDEPEIEESANFALKLTEALEAISAAQAEPIQAVPIQAEPMQATYSRPALRQHAARQQSKSKPAVAAAPVAEEVVSAAPPVVVAPVAMPAPPVVAPVVEPAAAAVTDDLEDLVALADVAFDAARPRNAVQRFLQALDKLPPIKLPIGPPIPWRLGLPMLVALVLTMLLLTRPSGPVENTGTRLPAQETYAVQQESPLFAKPAEAQPTPAAAPIGVSESAGMNVDFVDVGIKFAAVLGLAYGSLVLLKKFGMGGAAGAGSKGGASLAGVRVVSSMALAPNRTVHVIRTPGGKSFLLGATPTQVNLIADLGQLDDDALGVDSASNFFDVLASKLK